MSSMRQAKGDNSPLLPLSVLFLHSRPSQLDDTSSLASAALTKALRKAHFGLINRKVCAKIFSRQESRPSRTNLV